MASLVVAPSASALVPVDYCQYYPCQEGESYVVFSPPPAVIYPCDANGHAPDGALDATATLQAWIDLVPDGVVRNVAGSQITEWHVLLFPGGSCIRMEGQLTIQDRHYLIFDAGRIESQGPTVDGVTLDHHLRPAFGASHPITWFVLRGSFLQWRSFKVVGNHPEKHISLGVPTKVSTYGWCHDDPATVGINEAAQTCEWQAAWRFLGTRHAWLDGNESRNTHGDSVEIGWDYPIQPPNAIDARYITINNHKVFGAGRQGISAVSGQDITITNSYIEGAAQVGVDIEPEQPLFPVRRWTITNNEFGQSYATIAQLAGANTCTEVSDIDFSYNVQVEPNITSWPAVTGTRPSGCSAQRGPLTITNNAFWAEEWWYDGDSVAGFDGYSNVTFNSNSVKLSCYPGTGCAGNQTPVTFVNGGTGHVVSGNDFAVSGSQAWSSVYAYNGVVHGSLGTNVTSCGNTTSTGNNQPNAC